MHSFNLKKKNFFQSYLCIKKKVSLFDLLSTLFFNVDRAVINKENQNNMNASILKSWLWKFRKFDVSKLPVFSKFSHSKITDNSEKLM